MNAVFHGLSQKSDVLPASLLYICIQLNAYICIKLSFINHLTISQLYNYIIICK